MTRSFDELIHAVIDGEATDAERAEVSRQVAADPAQARAFARLALMYVGKRGSTASPSIPWSRHAPTSPRRSRTGSGCRVPSARMSQTTPVRSHASTRPSGSGAAPTSSWNVPPTESVTKGAGGTALAAAAKA